MHPIPVPKHAQAPQILSCLELIADQQQAQHQGHFDQSTLVALASQYWQVQSSLLALLEFDKFVLRSEKVFF